MPASSSLKLLLILSLAASAVLALDINLSNKTQHCFFLEIPKDETIQIQYEVTGYKAELFKMTIFDTTLPKTADPLHTIENEKQSRFDLYSPTFKEYKVCFQSLDNSGKILQFEFQQHKQSSDKYASDKSLNKTSDDINDVNFTLSNIYANFRHSLMRTEVQSKILDSTENKVKWCSVIKMVLMVSITAVQIVFLTGLFKNYSPLGV